MTARAILYFLACLNLLVGVFADHQVNGTIALAAFVMLAWSRNREPI